jgi:antitoxin (DNA-binding transcriptional repressor) of toxin-antitoxin stability system
MNVVEAEKNFVKLVDKVYAEGISVDLERDDKVIARLIPVEPISPPALSSEEWRVRILETAGKWKGELERPEQGEYEQREPLS